MNRKNWWDLPKVTISHTTTPNDHLVMVKKFQVKFAILVSADGMVWYGYGMVWYKKL